MRSSASMLFRVLVLSVGSFLGLGAFSCSSDDEDSGGTGGTCSPDDEGCVEASGGSGGSTPSCLSGTYQKPKCSDCAPNEYCEPGSSAAGIRCLQPCSDSSECCAPLTCMQNEWVSSYQGTICSTNGL